ncbi:hypothetical protein [Microbacterium immunditiarum]|uniref:Phage tail protein n=1 Tax=Microbacterium immunditiarum TaxID=337480 RepID=A0A7Y9KLQ2_9MICO|nr:hypothetical protein [Microbacterium immunditiarum]NYE20513.1 hypothetical protein [Microbacterium immunditiarum]
MPEIAANPHLFKATFTLGEDSFTAHLSKAEYVPTQPTGQYVDLSGKAVNFGGESSWILDLAGCQDWSTANSLSAYLDAHEGEEVEATITEPSGATHVGTVVCAAVNKGGTANSPALWAKQLQANGKPQTTYPV